MLLSFIQSVKPDLRTLSAPGGFWGFNFNNLKIEIQRKNQTFTSQNIFQLQKSTIL